MQEQLEAEYEGLPDFGDPLDPEEASEEDIAAELSRRRVAESSAPEPGDIRTEEASEEAEFGLTGSLEGSLAEEPPPFTGAILAAGESLEEDLEENPEDNPEYNAEDNNDADPAGLEEAPPFGASRPFPASHGEMPEEPRRKQGGAPFAKEAGQADRLLRLWEGLSRPGVLSLTDLQRVEDAGRRQDRWIYATGKTQDGQSAAVVATPGVDSHLLIHALHFLTDLLAEKQAVRHLYLCAPYFEDELRKAAYLVDPKKIRLRLVRIGPFGDGPGLVRTVETLRPETRDVNRSFADLLREVASGRTRKLFERFKEVAEGSLVESGGEGVVCRGQKVYFRMRGEDLLVARPRDNSVLLEILVPRGRTLRLSEKNFSQTLSRVRECFESARKSPNLGSREGSFRLAVYDGLQAREHGLIPLDADVSVGPNRLRIDVLAARPDGGPVAVQVRTRLSLEDMQRGLMAFTALREQATLLKKLLGEHGPQFNPAAEAALVFVSLRAHEAAPAIADLLVPRVSFMRAKPEQGWWETTLKLEVLGGAGIAAVETAASAGPAPVAVARAPRAARPPRVERPLLTIEGKNPAVIVSHYDRDGVIANLVLARAVPNVISQRFMSSEDLITFFFSPEAQASFPETYDLYLTDLRFRPSTRLSPEAKEAFVESLRSHKGNISWIDHVYWQDFDRREIEGAIGKANLIIAPRERTAALAVAKALRIKDEFSSKLVELSNAKLSENEYGSWGKNWLTAIDYLRNDLDRIEIALKPLLEGKPEEIDHSLLEEGKRKEEEAEAYVASRDFRVVIFGTYKLVLVDLPEKQSFNYSSVTQKVRERYKAQLSITSFGNSETIIIANSFTTRHGMNMTQLKDHLKRRFEWLNPIQGHENVLTLKIEDLQNKKERLDQVLNEIARNRSLFA